MSSKSGIPKNSEKLFERSSLELCSLMDTFISIRANKEADNFVTQQSSLYLISQFPLYLVL